MSREYPGTALTLSEVVRQLVADGRLGAPTESDPPAKVLHDALLAKLRYEVLMQKALEQEAAKANKVMKACFPEKLLKGLKGVLAGVPNLGSTREAQAMADVIIGLFQGSEEATENSSHTGRERSEEKDGEKGEEKTAPLSCRQQDQEDKANSTQGTEQETVNTQGQEIQQEKTDSTQGRDMDSANPQGNSTGDASGKAEDPPEYQAIKSVLESTDNDWPEDVFEGLAEEMEGRSGGQAGGLSAVTTTPSVDRVEIDDEDKRAGQQLLWKTQAESARLAAQLTGLVQAKTLCRNRTGKRGKTLDGKRLHRMAIGDGRLFRRQAESITIDATLHLCLDISSSMSPRMELAREAVLALASTLNPINGVMVSASAYPGKNDRRVVELMKPGDALQDVAAALSALNAHDSTPMATGLWHAVHQVLQISAKRRLILMITDGAPDSDHVQPIRDLVKRCEQSGIDVIGLGINVTTVKTLFPQSLVIRQLDELKVALFGLAKLWLVA